MHNHLQILKKEYFQSRRIILVVFLFFMAAAFAFVATADMRMSSAASTASFRPGNIISDAVMANYNSMSVSDIQNFLNSKNKCDNRDYDQYLSLSKAYPNINWHWEGEPYNGHFVCMAEEKFGDGEVIGKGMTAAEIIYDAAQENHINPQVLLVLLQKESSLITDKVPNSLDYRKATGYGCPDTAACNSAYYGFKNQIYRAAELFRYTLDNGSISFPEGRQVYIGYHPTSSCGGSQVLIENRATAALYRYTPYQPNTAALFAGYGTGDQCSAYGNRNFYLYFTDWFGSTQAVTVDGEEITLPDGEYGFVSVKKSNYMLGVKNNSAELASFSSSNTQRWNIKRDTSTGYYQIINAKTSQPLITKTTNLTDGTNVISGSSSTCSKNWKIYRTTDNHLTFESACSLGMVLNVDGSSIKIATSTSATSQKWDIYTGQTIQDGIYILTSSLNSQKAIDVMSGKTTNGANIALWEKHGLPNQVWQLEYQSSTDSYIIKNAKSDKTLDLQGGKAQNGQNVHLWTQHGECSQRWKAIPTADGYYHFMSTCKYGVSLDLNGGKVVDGQNIQVWSTHNQGSQKWGLVVKEPIIAEGTYSIKAKTTDNLVLDIADGKTSEGANVLIWDYHGLGNQRWEISYNIKTDDYTIYNPTTKKSLDLNGGKAVNGQNVQIWSPHGECAQRWNINETSSKGYYYITSACNKNISLDVADSKIINGNNVLVWTKHGGSNQQWQFIEQD